ncbi:Bcr/CflA family efflux MFS transporter [Thiorhodococcus fuscus]|uniref:Bcr/CflA family efflux transporter n=1 Tax=Thiorhodococcus fuscus TaxID=527200 RepID=A0ABW4Y6P0_9GAMM
MTDAILKPREASGRALLMLSAYLILVTALVRLGTSLYLPALPAMADGLGLSAQHMAATMTVYLVGFAVASIFLGPVSDHWGRKLLLQGGVIAFGVGSLLCALAPSYGLLVSGRILQSVGGAAVQVGSRAMSRDAFSDAQMISVLGWIGVITGLVPVLAPMLGGLLTQWLGWHSNFYLLAAGAVLVMLSTRGLVGESLPADRRTPFRLAETLRAYGDMLVSPGFMLPTIPIMLCFAVQGAYLVAAPFIFIHVLNMSPLAFGFTSLALVGGLLLGRLICMEALKRWGEYGAFLTGAGVALIGGLCSLGVVLAGSMSVVAILGASAVFCIGFGALVPIGMKAGLSVFADRVGTSSALYGCLTLGATALGSGVVGGMLERSARDIDLLCLATFIASVLILLSSLTCRRVLSKAA